MAQSKEWDTETRRNDKLAIFVFVLAGYISLNIMGLGMPSNILGLLFFTSAVFGAITLGKGIGYIFS